MLQRTGKKFNKPGWKLHSEHFIWIFHMELGNTEIFLCGADRVDILAPYLFRTSCQVHRLVLSNPNDLFVFIMIFFCSTSWNNKSKSERVTSADPDPFSSVCVVFYCKPWGLMILQREEIIPGPVSCFSPSWTICWHFWSWWLPFEPCGGYWKAQPCEVTSEGITFCLLKVTQRDFTFSDLT